MPNSVSKVVLNGDTLIDVTQKTVDSGNLLYGETALKNDGTGVTGEYVPNEAYLSVKSGKYWEYYVGREPDGNALFSDNLSSSQTKTISPSLAIGDVYFASISAKNTGDADWTFTREEYFQGCSDDEPWWIEGEANVRIGDTTVQTDYSHFDINHVEIYATQKTVDGYNPVCVEPLHLQYSSVYPDEVGTVVTPVGDSDGIAQVTVYPVSNTYVGSGVPRNDSTSLSASGATVTAPAGFYNYSASKAVASGTEGTPVATKGTVSSHSVTVTPSVTNVAGYISGGSKTGTAVTVSASELVSGTKSITANGTNIDVTDYAAVDVSVSGGVTVDSLNVTSNGTYTAQTGHAYSPVTVNVGGEDPDAVLFYDYDGTVVYRYSKTQFNALTEMPANPTHTGLTSQGWNWSLSDAKTHLLSHSQLDVGPHYIPTDGKTKFHITLGEGDLDVTLYFYQSKSNGVEFDWGDGSPAETNTVSGNTIIQHTYGTTGSYTISAGILDGTWRTRQGYIRGFGNADVPFFGYKNILRGVNIGSGFAHSGTYIFSNNTSLEYVTVPSSFQFLSGTSPFRQCESLKQLTVSDQTTSLAQSFVQNCYSLKSISISNRVKSISANALEALREIERLPIPNSVTNFSQSNLGGMFCLKSIEYPTMATTVPSVGYGAQLKSITVPNGVTTYGGNSAYQYSVESVSLPSTLETLSSGAFYGMKLLKSITLPTGLKSIGGNCFCGCEHIESLSIPSTVTTISQGAFDGMYSIQSLTIPSNVSFIETCTFRYCHLLENLVLPIGIKLKNNASNAFYDCWMLKHISIGFDGTNVPSSAFYNCQKLLDFTISNTVTTIKSGAFQQCYSLTAITIPGNVTSIESNAFNSCYNLEEVHLLPTNPPTLANTSAFSNVPATFYVPTASLDAYKTATNWSTYASRMVGE